VSIAITGKERAARVKFRVMSGSVSLWVETLRAERKARGLSQASLAAAAGLAEESVTSYEAGRRRPSRRALLRLGEALNLPRERLNGLLAEAGFDPEPAGVLEELKGLRVPLEELRAELATYSWPCLVMNDFFEIVAWNEAANTFAELDFGRDLPAKPQRQLLRMAATPHFRARLVNWDEVISVMLSMYRFERVDVEHPDTAALYFRALVEELSQADPGLFGYVVGLWQSAKPWPDGSRICFPVSWRTGDGVPLAINCISGPWSDFDAEFAFDWHPADAATWTWLESNSHVRQTADYPGPAAEPHTGAAWNDLLRATREGVRMSRRQVAQSVGTISKDTVYSYERGTRRPTRASLLTLTRAMQLDGATTNLILAAAGMDPEPSDWSLFLSGQPERTTTGRYTSHGIRRTWAQMQAEIANHDWPCLIVNDRCEVMCANDAASRITGIDFLATPPGAARNLVVYVTGGTFRRSVVNWSEVATAVLPGSLEPYFRGRGTGEKAPYFHSVIDEVRRHNEASLRELLDLWQATPRRRLTARITFPMTWDEGGTTLRFNCVIAPWNAYDPAWAIDWHPADAVTWEWLSGR